MGWSDRIARQQAAVFAALGDDAIWQGVDGTVRVILRDDDTIIGTAVTDRIMVKVRQSEVADPRDGDQVVTEDGRTFTINDTPLLDRKMVWTCGAAQVA